MPTKKILRNLRTRSLDKRISSGSLKELSKAFESFKICAKLLELPAAPNTKKTLLGEYELLATPFRCSYLRVKHVRGGSSPFSSEAFHCSCHYDSSQRSSNLSLWKCRTADKNFIIRPTFPSHRASFSPPTCKPFDVNWMIVICRNLLIDFQRKCPAISHELCQLEGIINLRCSYVLEFQERGTEEVANKAT